MKKIGLAVIALLIAAVPAMAGGDKCGAANAQVCLKDWSGKKSHAWMGAEFDKSVPGVMTVKAIAPGSPAATAEFQVGDEVTAINGASVADKEALKKAKGEWKAGQVILYTVKRKGADHQISATLAPMPEEAFAAMLGRHMMDHHMAMTTASADVKETDTKDKK